MDENENRGYPAFNSYINALAEKESQYPVGGESIDNAHRQQNRSSEQLSEQNISCVSPTQCDVCGEPIPPTDTTCPQHGNTGGYSGAHSRDYNYQIKYISLAVVDASNKYQAIALAAAAHDHLPDTIETVDESELLHNVEKDHIKYDITDAWDGNYSDVVPLDSDQAITMLNRLQEVQLNDSNMSGIVLGEFGEQITVSKQACIEETNSKKSWVVPGVCYNTKRNLIGETVRTRQCRSCGETDHVWEGTNAKRSLKEDGYWTCLNCDQSHRDVRPMENDQRGGPQSDHPMPTEGTAELRRKQFERIMQSIETDDDLSLEP